MLRKRDFLHEYHGTQRRHCHPYRRLRGLSDPQRRLHLPAVRQALEIGYRHIDTAAAYFNEGEVGQAVRESGIPGKRFSSPANSGSKITAMGPPRQAFRPPWTNWAWGYIDLYLIHQPYGDVPGAWKAMEEAKTTGKLHAIGVSNMTPKSGTPSSPSSPCGPPSTRWSSTPFSSSGNCGL